MGLARRRGLLAGLGALLVAVGAGWWWAQPAPSPPHARLLPDVGGPIVLAAATASSARRSALRSAALVTELGRVLPRRIVLLLLTNDRSAFTLRSPQREVRFVEVEDASALTIWPQDPFVVLRTPSGASVLLASRDFERATDREMALALARELGWKLRRSQLYFEGGNLVSDEETVLLGADTVARNASDLGVAPEQVAARFERELGRPVVVLGPSPQPVPHIDLAVTPIGEGRVLVADSAAAAALVEGALAADPELGADFEERARERFFGDPRIDRVGLGDGAVLEPPEIRTADAVEESRRLAPHLDGVARGLAERGFRVSRVPLLIGARSEDGGPGFPWLSYNNALMERVGSEDRVYLPRYGLSALDAAGVRAWREQGFAVVPVDGLTTSAMYGGALRCALKVLAREDPNPRR